MKRLLAFLLPISLACVAPKPTSEGAQAKKENEFHYWQATLRSMPSKFPFPSDLPGLGVKGFVEVDLKVDTQGNPSNAVARDSQAIFAKTAENFVSACKFQPAKLNDQWMESKFRVKVFFNSPTKSITLLTTDGKPFRPAEFR